MGNAEYMGEIHVKGMARLLPQRAFLCVCDVQEKFLVDSLIHEMPAVVSNTKMMCEVATALEVPIVCTEQYPKVFANTCASIGMEDLKTNGAAQVFEPKFTFSMLGVDAEDADNAEFGCTTACSAHITSIITGVETHVCVQQTVLDLLAAGATVSVVADAVSSRRTSDRSMALQLMQQAGARITTSESLIYSLLGGSKHPAFKAVNELLKPHREAGFIGNPC